MSKLDAPTKIALENLASHIKNEQCILFLGAGIHAEPPKGSDYVYPEDQRPALAWKLTQLLGEECGFAEEFPEEPLTLMRVALCYETGALGEASLIRSLKRHLEDEKTPSPAVDMVAQLPFPIIVTTNYDRLLDQTLQRAALKDPTILRYSLDSDRPAEDIMDAPTAQRPLLFKIHGDLSKPESIVITDEDYITFVQRMSDKFHPVPETILFYLKRWPTLFLGYSLRDFNLRLLFQTLRWRVDSARFPPALSVDSKPDPLILKVWQDKRQFVTFVTEDLWTCVPWLYERILGKGYGS